MSESNSSKPNLVRKQLFRLYVIPAVRYVFTLYYILLTPRRFFTFALKKEITSYGDTSDDLPRSPVRQPLYPITYLTTTTAFIIIVIYCCFDSPESSPSSQELPIDWQFIFFLMIASIIYGIYMAFITGKFKYVTFFINYYCYNFSIFYFIGAAYLLLFDFLSILFAWNRNSLFSEESSVMWLVRFCFLVFYLYLCIVHPVLTFHKVFRINVRLLVVSTLLFWILVLIGG